MNSLNQSYMKKILCFVCVAMCALSACSKLETSGFRFPKADRMEPNSICSILTEHQERDITSGFVWKDDNRNCTILLNVCDPIMARNLKAPLEPYGIIIHINEADFGKVVNTRYTGGNEGTFFDEYWYYGKDDIVKIHEGLTDDVITVDRLYVDRIFNKPLGLLNQYVIKGYRCTYLDTELAFCYEGKLVGETSGATDFINSALWSQQCWMCNSRFSGYGVSTYGYGHYCEGIIPDYVKIEKVWLEWRYSIRDTYSKWQTTEVDLKDISYPETLFNPPMVSLKGYGYGEDAIEGHGVDVRVPYKFENLVESAEYEVQAMAVVSYKGYTEEKCIAIDRFTVM